MNHKNWIDFIVDALVGLSILFGSFFALLGLLYLLFLGLGYYFGTGFIFLSIYGFANWGDKYFKIFAIIIICGVLLGIVRLLLL